MSTYAYISGQIFEVYDISVEKATNPIFSDEILYKVSGDYAVMLEEILPVPSFYKDIQHKTSANNFVQSDNLQELVDLMNKEKSDAEKSAKEAYSKLVAIMHKAKYKVTGFRKSVMELMSYDGLVCDDADEIMSVINGVSKYMEWNSSLHDAYMDYVH